MFELYQAPGSLFDAPRIFCIAALAGGVAPEPEEDICSIVLQMKASYANGAPMLRVDQLAEDYGLNQTEVDRLRWVVNTFGPQEHESELKAEIKNIMAARQIAAMSRPLITKDRAARIRKTTRELTKNGFWESGHGDGKAG